MRNWPEILSDQRASSFSLGPYASSLFSYPDLRNGGYKYNYGVPGFRTWDWTAVCESTVFDTFSGDLITSLRYPTRLALERHFDEVDAVVIFLGGNDLKSNYSGIFNDADPPPLLAEVVANIAEIHDYVRNQAPALPIIIATAPDIGATAEVAGKYTDPALRVRARERIAAMNASIRAMATMRGAQVAGIDGVTDRIFDQVPVRLNGTENPPDSLFCKDGFHPGTMIQALLANEILDALNRAAAAGIPSLAQREILGPVVGLNPDQPYIDWAAGAGGMFEDADGDGLPNLTEFVLSTPPNAAGSPFVFESGGLVRFSTSAEALEFASLTVEESALMTGWQPVPEARILIAPDGSWRVSPSTATATFYRLAVTPRP
jgi:lysophospholipase L1-like esterase